jgi:hypothetical protein
MHALPGFRRRLKTINRVVFGTGLMMLTLRNG